MKLVRTGLGAEIHLVCAVSVLRGIGLGLHLEFLKRVKRRFVHRRVVGGIQNRGAIDGIAVRVAVPAAYAVGVAFVDSVLPLLANLFHRAWCKNEQIPVNWRPLRGISVIWSPETHTIHRSRIRV